MKVKALVSNLRWKAFSLLLAVVLWLAVVAEPDLVTSQSAPVFYKNLPRDLEIGSDVPDRVHLEIRGPAGKITPTRLAEANVLLDLADVRAPGERTFTVNSASIHLPADVELLRAVPSQLRLRFERVLVKVVPVVVRRGVPPPAGRELASVQVTPSVLRITGPESRVRLIETAQTDPIDLGTTEGKAEFRVHAYVADPQVRVDGSPMVAVKVDVEKKTSQ